MKENPKMPDLSDADTFFASDDFKDFVANRNIRDDDYPLIASLAKFSNSDIVEYLHNVFNDDRERSGVALLQNIAGGRPEKAKEIFSAAKNFFDAYDWTAAYNLVRVLERRKKK